MEEKEFEKMWKKFLIDIEKSEAEVAKEIGTSASNLNQKIKNKTIRYIELNNIVNRYGYDITIRKK